MSTESVILLIQIILMFAGAAITVIPAFYKMRSQRRAEEASAADMEASAANKLTASAMEIVKQCEKEIADLKKSVARLERHLDYWQRGCVLLIKQLVDNDIVPVWDPNGGPEEDDV